MKTTLLLLVLLGITIHLHGQNRLPVIDKKELKQSVSMLASDSLQGRGVGMEGAQKAAQAIVRNYQEAGLEPLTDAGYLETFVLRTVYWDQVYMNIGGRRFDNFEQMVFQYGPPQNEVVSKEIVFGGTGSDEELDQIEVADRLVLVFVKNLRATHEINKKLSKRKAFGMITANLENERQYLSVKRTYKSYALARRIQLPSEAREAARMSKRFASATPTIGTILIPNEQVPNILGLPTEKLQRLIKKRRITEAGTRKATVLFKKVDQNIETANVVGRLPGASQQTIVISAHYDHLGPGPFEGSYYAGADDNASGVSAMMALARHFSSADSLRYNMVFIAFSAEEGGLKGSKYHVNSETFDSTAIACNINLDMVGRRDEEHTSSKYLYYIGAGQSATLDSLLTKADSAYTKCKIDYTIEGLTGLFRRSDHYSFYQKGIPAVMFFSGLHKDYHKTTDTADKIDYKNLSYRVAQIATFIELLQESEL